MITLDSQFTPDEATWMERLYTDAFPPQERRPWSGILEPVRREGPRLSCIRRDGRPVGMITLWHFPEFIYVEHFAIAPEHRGSGIGSSALTCLLESRPAAPERPEGIQGVPIALEEPDGIQNLPIVLEVERPEVSDEARRRVGFYRRNGFEISDYPYIQPPYGPDLPSVPMRLMFSHPQGTSSHPLDPSSVATHLHRTVYTNP